MAFQGDAFQDDAFQLRISPEQDFGREPLTLVEVDQDYCLLIYGTAPCTAILGSEFSLSYSFMTEGELPDGVTFSRATIDYDGSYFDENGVLIHAGPDEARWQYGEFRTNWLRNNSGVGGAVGTPGTLPTNWTLTLRGLNSEVTFLDTAAGRVRIRFYGTTTSGGDFLVRFDAVNAIAGIIGQKWCGSVNFTLVDDTLPPGDFRLVVNGRTASGTGTETYDHDFSGDVIIGEEVRPELGTTLTLTTSVRVSMQIAMAGLSSTDYDFEIELRLPQQEVGLVATEEIITTGTGRTVGELLGLLNEPERTTIVGYTENFNTSGTDWVSIASNLTANYVAAPDLTVTADRMEANNTATTGQVVRYQTISLENVQYAQSWFSKPETSPWVIINASGFTPDNLNGNAFADTANAEPGANHTTALPAVAVAYASGWTRVSVIRDATLSDGTPGALRYQMAVSDGVAAVDRDGVPLPTTGFWGAMMEAVEEDDLNPSTYIPNAGSKTSPKTRAADVVTLKQPDGNDLPSGVYDITISRYGEADLVLTEVEITGGSYQVPTRTAPLQSVELQPRFLWPNTGIRKCFNTFKTCQDPDNFTKETLTLRFGYAQTALPKDLGTIFPALRGVSTNPTEINIGGQSQSLGPLGRRASVTVSLKDFPYHDRYVDKYQTERVSGAAQFDGIGYDPFDRGTFFTKWKARSPYWQGRSLRVREGYVGQPLDEMRTRHYVIEDVQGPSSDGSVSITAKDILKLADDDRAVAPRASTGKLAFEITEDSTTVELLPEGVGDLEYPVAGRAVIGNELVRFVRDEDTVTLLERGVRGTEVRSHSAEDSFQLTLTYDNQRVYDVLYDLLVSYGNIDPAYIPFDDWKAEIDLWLPDLRLTTDITEPTGVSKLVGEIQAIGPYIWWDELSQLIELRALRPELGEIDTIWTDNGNLLPGIDLSEQPNERASQVWMYYGQLDPTDSLTSASNYGKLRVSVDLEAERAIEYGQQRIKKIYTRWLTSTSEGVVLGITSRILQRFRDTPKVMMVKTDAKDRDSWTGDVLDVETRINTDETGLAIRSRWQIVSAEEFDSGHQVRYKLQVFDFQQDERSAFIVSNDTPDYNAATEEQKATGGWISNDDGTMPDGTDAYRII